MIKLSNGHEIRYLAASGALAFDGLGWLWEWPLRWLGLLDPVLFTVVVKTLTRYPRKGNLRWWWPWGCIRLLWGGVLNAVGLTNPGIEHWYKEVWPKIRDSRRKIRLIISIYGTPQELVEMAGMINDLDDPDHIIVGIQINDACPNSGDDIVHNAHEVILSCKMVKKASRFPISLSVSVVQDIEIIVAGTRDIVELYTINSVPWKTVFSFKKSPLSHLGGGGVSGKIVQPITWGLAMRMEKLGVPVAWPSIWEMGDLAEMRKHGKVGAISFGSIFLCHPLRPTKIVLQDMREDHSRNA